jgi:hypothetical protein
MAMFSTRFLNPSGWSFAYCWVIAAVVVNSQLLGRHDALAY